MRLLDVCALTKAIISAMEHDNDVVGRIGDESDSNGPIIDDFGRRETLLGYAALLFQ